MLRDPLVARTERVILHLGSRFSKMIVMRRPHFLMSVLILTAAAAQTPPTKDHSLGYDDTPFLPDGKWRVHDVNRPRPPLITPGTESSTERPGRPPSDAIDLFDGTDLSKWTGYLKGEQVEPKWKVQNGYMEV